MRHMRRAVLSWAVAITLAAMLGGHVTELFDHWDHTLRTGKDADYTTVFVAACVGFVFAVATLAAAGRRRLRPTIVTPAQESRPMNTGPFLEAVATGPSPPVSACLRI